MNTKYLKISLGLVIVLLMAFTSCVKDLNTVPLDKDVVTSATVYDDPDSYKQVLAKLYAGLAVSGQEGPHGMPDISGIDEGFSTYLRQYWKAQELTTDEAVIAWNDGNLRDYHEQDWSASNEFITAMYNRIYYQISLCNEYIRETTDEKLDGRGVSGSLRTEVEQYRAEARFLRAFSYWHAMDMFGNVPFVTEEQSVGAFLPEQTTREQLFNYVESELLAIENELIGPTQNEYGRVDQAAAWMLLSKIYLNAVVYTSLPRYSDAVTYSEKVISSGYTLDPVYQNLFLADNHTAQGIIFPVLFDGIHTRTWGGMTFVVHAAVGGSMTPADYGIDGGWGGTRTTKNLVGMFYNLDNLKSFSFVNHKSYLQYPVLYVPGDHQGWDPSDTTSILASVNSDTNYEGYINVPGANSGFKITDSPNWDNGIYGDVDGGGTSGTLTSPGNNILAVDPGYYKLNVDMTANTYTLFKTDWGIIGDATPGGWDTDENMTYDETEGVWSVIVELGTGAFKFRANDGWDLDYGDNGADGILDQGGDNIAVSEPGKYLIKLKLGAPDYTYSIEKFSSDDRGMFYTDGQSLEIADIFEFTEGYAISKFSNLSSTGAIGSDLTFPDTDYPVFRLADAYLIYAEATLRGGTGGDAAIALSLINSLRERAYGDTGGNIIADDLTLDFILDERARELFWEGHRRTDLIRYGKFSNTDYLWPWKGGIEEGISVDSKYDLLPIPDSDIGANPNLKQNPGY